MNTPMTKRKLTAALVSLFALCMTVVAALLIWAENLQNTIQTRLAGKRWSAPTEFYSGPEQFFAGQPGITKILSDTLERLEYKLVQIDRPLQEGEFAKWPGEMCKQKISSLSGAVKECWSIKPHKRPDALPGEPDRSTLLIAVNADDIIDTVYEGEPPQPATRVELEPELFAQFYGGAPVLRKIISIGDVPPYLLNAILAIEDSQFLTHHGVSWTGMLRAAARNILKGHVSEGGSTITQQLIKNYFLDSRRTFKRKVTEILMALILESQYTKDDILGTYINEVYLGQEGPFEIHGVGVASKYYFNKHPDDISLAEAALIAGMIRGPHIYSPAAHADRALARRNAVLKRMLELNLIGGPEYAQAMAEPVHPPTTQLLRDVAPFFIDAVKFQLKNLNLPDPEGMQVFTTLNVRAQKAATEAVTSGLEEVEKKYASIPKLEKKFNAKLQGVLISADPTDGYIQAVVGGRSYAETQLNRAVQSHRQVGSIFKPFVYLTALTSGVDQDGHPYTPLTPVMDEAFTINYDRQSWSPKNYEPEFEGKIPLYHALEESLNAATAKVELQIGIPKVVETAKAMGIESPLMAVPSLALGVADLTPLEVLTSYSAFSRGGNLIPLTFITKVMTATHNLLYEYKPAQSQVADSVAVAQTVSLMEVALDHGTGRSIRELGFSPPAAGKTGTTSDLKDAWFGGFTPLHAAVAWVGFDTPETTGLSGALGAIPIWYRYMKTYATTFPPTEFQIPEGAVKVVIDRDTGLVANPGCPHKVTLVFRKGTEPTQICSVHQ
jgi:penicillin-binding protein 1B